MDILIDYLRFTSKIHSLASIIDQLGLDKVEWMEGKSRDGWLYHGYFSGMHVYHGGRDDIGVELSGVGCRTLESYWNKQFDWFKLIAYLIENKEQMNVSRLDVACDDREILNIRKITDYTRDRKYISKARRCVWMSGDEEEVIFGSTQSSTRLRIYNKALERGVEGPWTRVEFQLRDESADSFMLNLMAYKDIGRVFSGVLLNYLRYTTKAPDPLNHHDRLRTVRWWDEFVGSSEKIRNVTVGGLEYNFSNLENFITKQCLSSLKAFVEINGGSVDPLLKMISEARMNAKQEELVKRLKINDQYQCRKKDDQAGSTPDDPNFTKHIIEQNINFVQFRGGENAFTARKVLLAVLDIRQISDFCFIFINMIFDISMPVIARSALFSCPDAVYTTALI